MSRKAVDFDGNKLILWTCRIGEALSNAVAWCQEHRLEFDAVNDNLPEIVEYYGSNSRKITCDGILMIGICYLVRWRREIRLHSSYCAFNPDNTSRIICVNTGYIDVLSNSDIT